jgi:AcrR family transcriptional regulator
MVPDGVAFRALGASGSASPAGSVDARTRLREAALDLIGRQGLQATSTREIIAAAGLRNPSAISYYFGSKADLVAELVGEVNRDESRIIQRQVALAEKVGAPSPEAWAGVAIDAAINLLSSVRGCRLIRVWAELDELRPDAVEQFLASEHELARAWRAAVITMFPDLPPAVAIARNVIVLRTLQWMTVRRARRVVDGSQAPWPDDPLGTRTFVLEIVLNILTPPTALRDLRQPAPE